MVVLHVERTAPSTIQSLGDRRPEMLYDGSLDPALVPGVRKVRADVCEELALVEIEEWWAAAQVGVPASEYFRNGLTQLMDDVNCESQSEFIDAYARPKRHPDAPSIRIRMVLKEEKLSNLRKHDDLAVSHSAGYALAS
jgi:hypothetical protein